MNSLVYKYCCNKTTSDGDKNKYLGTQTSDGLMSRTPVLKTKIMNSKANMIMCFMILTWPHSKFFVVIASLSTFSVLTKQRVDTKNSIWNFLNLLCEKIRALAISGHIAIKTIALISMMMLCYWYKLCQDTTIIDDVEL